MAGDALASREFASITGPAGEGVLITFPPDPRKRPTAAAIVKKFKDKGIDPEGYVLYTYAAFQAWAQAAAKAGTTDPQKVAAAMRAGTWDTVLGRSSYDKKGDITSGGWAVYRWDKDGNYDEIYREAGGARACIPGAAQHDRDAPQTRDRNSLYLERSRIGAPTRGVAARPDTRAGA